MQYNFVLDGVVLYSPEYPWWSICTKGERMKAPVSFQLSIDTVSAGAHNATISIYGSDINNDIFCSTLLIQPYIS